MGVSKLLANRPLTAAAASAAPTLGLVQGCVQPMGSSLVPVLAAGERPRWVHEHGGVGAE